MKPAESEPYTQTKKTWLFHLCSIAAPSFYVAVEETDFVVLTVNDEKDDPSLTLPQQNL
jgi:hypothetical protein